MMAHKLFLNTRCHNFHSAVIDNNLILNINAVYFYKLPLIDFLYEEFSKRQQNPDLTFEEIVVVDDLIKKLDNMSDKEFAQYFIHHFVSFLQKYIPTEVNVSLLPNGQLTFSFENTNSLTILAQLHNLFNFEFDVLALEAA